MHVSNFFEIHNFRVSPLKAEAETGFGYTWFIDGDCHKGARGHNFSSKEALNRENSAQKGATLSH